MCRPQFFAVDYVINPWMAGNLGRLDLQRAQRQWAGLRDALAVVTETYPPEAVARMSGVSVEDQTIVGRQLLAAKQPLVLGTGAGSAGSHAVAAELAALFLNSRGESAVRILYHHYRTINHGSNGDCDASQ